MSHVRLHVTETDGSTQKGELKSQYSYATCQMEDGICLDLARLAVPQRKCKTDQRKKQLLGCRRLVTIEVFFKATFKTSIFTKLATRCGFS
jgi:hypothetical protein